MRHGLKLFLPLVQVVVAAVLMTSHYLGPDTVSNPSWAKADWQTCSSLNAPASVVIFSLHHAADRWFPGNTLVGYLTYYFLDTICYLALIAILWYLVSKEMTDVRGGWQSSLTYGTRFRPLADTCCFYSALA
jgi:hypothetical protein